MNRVDAREVLSEDDEKSVIKSCWRVLTVSIKWKVQFREVFYCLAFSKTCSTWKYQDEKEDGGGGKRRWWKEWKCLGGNDEDIKHKTVRKGSICSFICKVNDEATLSGWSVNNTKLTVKVCCLNVCLGVLNDPWQMTLPVAFSSERHWQGPEPFDS